MRASFFAIMASAVVLGGCSTGILPAGPDTYTITERMTVLLGGSDVAERDAVTKASDFCTQKGLEYVPNNMNTTPGNPSNFPSYTVTFQCLSANDPRVANFHLQQAPNVIIEQRNR